ncbi:MAG: hypothetical protein ABTS16_11725 [Candidatus Accumulibacter phosphatis]|uniref:Uncharacterized protein n=1 Tax=Candidatus Accumulibacter contiguus TaxID=2954381 RepID=A0ABX1TDS8_9PROT|nr:hypothetical protein [Candidatus Accumulibacter contiguus]NMQ06720.1 hypothetical protein [Candidatus Accumulibacter contiguus]
MAEFVLSAAGWIDVTLLRRREAQGGEGSSGLYGAGFDIDSRRNPALLFKKPQKGTGADLAAMVRQQEVGTSDLVVFKQEYARYWRIRQPDNAVRR